MAASKLFTPVTRTKQGTPIEAEETARIFMNPPTHPEIPVFDGPCDRGEAQNPLRLSGSGQSSTKPVSRRGVGSVKRIIY
ncbi:MAG TPA: hypothetical protein VKP13_09590 [Nitrospira sp.]|nr:hypothetical protein [Nitrospira sp.]